VLGSLVINALRTGEPGSFLSVVYKMNPSYLLVKMVGCYLS
jgi:hypothetical protein